MDVSMLFKIKAPRGPPEQAESIVSNQGREAAS
jgi:hypothetical protein